LVDENEIIKIVDTKSLMPTENGVYKKSPVNEWYEDLIETLGISPPEFRKNPPVFSVDKAHVYMLGKDLYQILMGYDVSDLARNSRKGIVFCTNVFRGVEGETFKRMIELMITPDPAKRPSMMDVLKTLKDLKNYHACQDFVDELNKNSLVQNNPVMMEQLQKITNNLSSLKSFDSLASDYEELSAMLDKANLLNNMALKGKLGEIKSQAEPESALFSSSGSDQSKSVS